MMDIVHYIKEHRIDPPLHEPSVALGEDPKLYMDFCLRPSCRMRTVLSWQSCTVNIVRDKAWRISSLWFFAEISPLERIFLDVKVSVFPCEKIVTLVDTGVFDNENILGWKCISRGFGECFS